MSRSAFRVARRASVVGAFALAIGVVAVPSLASAAPTPAPVYTLDHVEHSDVTGGGYSSALAYDAAGNLYAAQPDSGIIRVRDAATGAWSQLAVPGIVAPAAVAVSPSDDSLWVTDLQGGAVAHRDGAGTWTTVVAPGSINAYGISVDAAGDVFMIDSFHARVLELAAGSTTWSDITGSGTWGHLTDVAATADGTVYVADGNSGEAGVYQLGSGGVWTNITPSGLDPDEVYSPGGLATSPDGDLAVTDSNQWIKIRNAETGAWTQIGSQGTADGQFLGLNDIALLGDHVAAVDAGTGAVTFFTRSTAPVATVPTVTKQPVAASTTVGGPTTFTVVADGSPAPTVQWQRSTDGGTTWTDVDGATGSSLTVTGATVAMNGDRFRAVVTNSAGSVTSDPAVLTVTAADTTGGGTGTGGTGTDTGTTPVVSVPVQATPIASTPVVTAPSASRSTDAAADPSALAYTGSDALPGIVAGVLAMLAGVAVSVIRRRRARA